MLTKLFRIEGHIALARVRQDTEKAPTLNVIDYRCAASNDITYADR